MIKTHIREYLIVLKTDTIFSWSWKITVVIFVCALGLMLLLWQRLPPLVPLFYSLPWGESQLTSPVALLLTTLGAIVIFILNAMVALRLYKNSLFFARLLVIAGAFVSLLVCITVGQIMLLVT